jgi:hypothetical protein
MSNHPLTRHPELVSPYGDFVPGSYFATLKIKMLKQVQHDGTLRTPFALSLSKGCSVIPASEKGQGFDRLSPNGFGGGV